MKREKISSAAASGVVALVFLVLGFQAALFTGNVFKAREKETETTVEPAATASDETEVREETHDNIATAALKVAGQAIQPIKETDNSDSRAIIAEKFKEATVKPFEFNPNIVTGEELKKLGFSERQANVILNYRNKGGKFRTKGDFAKMYVVDSVTFAKLEPFIKIPKVDLNTADSATLTTLRGIGPYYAAKIIEYRERLGGSFYSMEQLLEIEGFNRDRLDGFEETAELSDTPFKFDLWLATERQLEMHPYIGSYAAKGIIRYKTLVDSSEWTLDALVKNGILKQSSADRLYFCLK